MVRARSHSGMDVRTPLPCCPGWTVAHLLGHLGSIYVAVNKYVRDGTGEDIVNELEDLELAPEFEEWFRSGSGLEQLPLSVVDWYRESAGNLEETFAATDPAQRTWTWLPSNQTAEFWLRRMTHETIIHRWDVETAKGKAQAVGSDLASDGVDEALTVYQPRNCRPESKVKGQGETFRFEQTDGPSKWTVRLEEEDMQVSRDGEPAEVTLRGSGSELMLFLWHRIPGGHLAIEGDVSLVERYFELVPPD
ncbi:MAG: maleylpyruvate isomerase family mycothiol-dependent enzyme [Chloroflexota bacterium]